MSKISNLVGRNDNFLAKAQKLSILPTSLDIFYLQQHYIYLSSISGKILQQLRAIMMYETHYTITLQKQVRKVVHGFGKKSCASIGVRKPGNTYGVKPQYNQPTITQITDCHFHNIFHILVLIKSRCILTPA